MQAYDRADAAYYDYHSTGLAGDVAFYVAEALRAGSPVLELGCGTARNTLPIAEAGVEIVGLDRAPAMLAIARRKVASANSDVQRRITLVEGDMRDFALAQRFKLVLIPYRAFLHLLTPDDQRQALHNIRAHVADDGRLVFNIFDPRLETITAHGGSLGGALKRVTEFVHPESGRRVVVWDTREYDHERQVLDQYFIYEELDEAGRVLVKTYAPLTLRWVYRYEMQYLLELCGFSVEALYGDFARGPFRAGDEQIWIARRAAPQDQETR